MLAMLLPVASALAQSGQEMVVQRAGSQAPSIGAAQNFTGAVRVEGRFQGSPPARISGGTVIFEPGARTA
jgi:quercetin dioxygenase-like cupin family protein